MPACYPIFSILEPARFNFENYWIFWVTQNTGYYPIFQVYPKYWAYPDINHYLKKEMITKTPINILTLLSDQNTSRYQTFSKTLLQTALSFEHNVGSSWFWPIRNNFHTKNQNSVSDMVHESFWTTLVFFYTCISIYSNMSDWFWESVVSKDPVASAIQKKENNHLLKQLSP